MEKNKIISFFDGKAPVWDKASPISSDDIVNTILDNAGVVKGVSVLDIGCGTGVLVPYYLERDAASVIAVDFSEKMIETAKAKFADPRLKFVCADAETTDFGGPFDCCIIYHTFPHFIDPGAVIANLAKQVKKGGKITVAHGFSREMIDMHHHEVASEVSVELLPDDEIAALLAPYFDVTVTISDDKMQDMVGVRK